MNLQKKLHILYLFKINKEHYHFYMNIEVQPELFFLL